MLSSSPTTMFTSLVTLLLFSWICMVYSEPYTGNRFIIGLNRLSISYQNFTGLAYSLPNEAGSSQAEALVAQYQEYIDVQDVGAIELPQPPEPYPDVEQYGIVAAAHSVILVDRGFLGVVAIKKDSFTEDQREILAESISGQIDLIESTLDIFAVYAPKVQGILVADFAFLLDTIVEVAQFLRD